MWIGKYSPSWHSAPPLPTGHKHKNPGPVLLPKQVPPYRHGFVAQTGRSQRDPVYPGGQLQNHEPLSSCWVQTAPLRHGRIAHTADVHSTISRPDNASLYRWTSTSFICNFRNFFVNICKIYYIKFHEKYQINSKQ